ncbi:Bacteriophage lambda head decoration protein D [Modicisalibacter muralis]|uniref:Bacteriophage lambda head decoration protein D n=1 Tax=Modicisalibacter muralis TaxID=119000 RepID=A0A1G9MVD5_9GAMM|nr:head decoration protein [Halomonas muralis]SDL77857.1 Bacteriophage lambda head decoration protein D [Halomonas muralis]
MANKKHVEPRHTGAHIVSEANGARSREQGMLAAGNLPAGAVLALNAGGDYVALAPAATDGTEIAKAVLYAAADATDAPVPIVVHVRACEVHGEALTWPTGATEAQITAGTNDLVGLGVIVRD